MVYVQPSICPENETCKLLHDLEIQNDHLISARQPDLTIKKKIKKKDNL